MARFTGHLACQAFKVRALDELIELVKVYDWHQGDDGIDVRPQGTDYLFWGAAQVEDPRLVPFEVVPGRDGTLVEQPLRDPFAFDEGVCGEHGDNRRRFKTASRQRS